jgi:hypothetical protein
MIFSIYEHVFVLQNSRRTFDQLKRTDSVVAGISRQLEALFRLPGAELRDVARHEDLLAELGRVVDLEVQSVSDVEVQTVHGDVNKM